jgi:hypothetical protein
MHLLAAAIMSGGLMHKLYGWPDDNAHYNPARMIEPVWVLSTG